MPGLVLGSDLHQSEAALLGFFRTIFPLARVSRLRERRMAAPGGYFGLQPHFTYSSLTRDRTITVQTIEVVWPEKIPPCWAFSILKRTTLFFQLWPADGALFRDSLSRHDWTYRQLTPFSSWKKIVSFLSSLTIPWGQIRVYCHRPRFVPKDSFEEW